MLPRFRRCRLGIARLSIVFAFAVGVRLSAAVSGVVLGESGSNYVIFKSNGGWTALGDPQMISSMESLGSVRLVALGATTTNWVVVSGNNGWAGRGDTQMTDALRSINTAGRTIHSVSLGGNINEWAISHNGGWAARVSDSQLISRLNSISSVTDITLTDSPTTWFVRYGTTGWSARGPTGFINDLNAIQASGQTPSSVVFSRDGQSWVIFYGNGGYRSFVPAAMSDQMSLIRGQGFTIGDAAIGSADGSWAIIYGSGGYYVHGPDVLLSGFATASATAPTISGHPASVSTTAGQSVSFSVTASGSPAPSYQWRKNGNDLQGKTSAALTLSNVQAADAGTYSVVVSNTAGTVVSNNATLTVQVPTPPTITQSPSNQSVTSGASVSFVFASTSNVTQSYQWWKDGVAVTGGTGATLTVSNVQPANVGLYVGVATNTYGAVSSRPAILGVRTTSKVSGAGEIVLANIVHANGNIFDQLLINGTAAVFTADRGKITRLSFTDLNNDIVQVEFSGSGSVALVLDATSGPALPVNYNQNTSYMKGHAGIVVTGADETTNLSVFSVGRANAVNAALFKSNVTYDGMADLAYVAIASSNGKFGGLRAANASFSGTRGCVGVYAPGVQFTGPVYVSEIAATDAATPMLILGSGSDVRITGGDLWQANQRAVQVSGITQLRFVDGSTSHGALLRAQTNLGRLEQDGVDVTTQIVVNPAR